MASKQIEGYDSLKSEIFNACCLAISELDNLATNLARGIYHRPAYIALENLIEKLEKLK